MCICLIKDKQCFQDEGQTTLKMGKTVDNITSHLLLHDNNYGNHILFIVKLCLKFSRLSRCSVDKIYVPLNLDRYKSMCYIFVMASLCMIFMIKH